MFKLKFMFMMMIMIMIVIIHSFNFNVTGNWFQFEEEVLTRRDILFAFSTTTMPIALSTEKLELTNW